MNEMPDMSRTGFYRRDEATEAMEEMMATDYECPAAWVTLTEIVRRTPLYDIGYATDGYLYEVPRLNKGYAFYARRIDDSADRVNKAQACPACGEDRQDWLVCMDDDHVECTRCGVVYEPGYEEETE